MKIGITSSALTRLGDGAFGALRGAGFDGIDFNMMDTASPLYLMSEDELCAATAHIRALAETAGMAITQVHGPWRCPPQDATEEDREERFQKMMHSIRVCNMLGCKLWVVHPIMPFSTFDIDAGKQAETYEHNLAFFTRLARAARPYGVTVCVENMPFPEFSLATPDVIARLVREVDEENLKMCLDTGHVAVYPELSAPDAVRECGDVIRALHIHDNNGKSDIHLMPYIQPGVIDWKDFGVALREVGFGGTFSYETKPPDALADKDFIAMCCRLAEIAREIVG